MRRQVMGTVLFLGLLATAAPAADSLPDQSLNWKLAAPIRTWDEAIPLGNGLLGGLLWGETNLLRLSLDRGDLWDLRTPATIQEKGFTYAHLQQLVRAGTSAKSAACLTNPTTTPHQRRSRRDGWRSGSIPPSTWNGLNWTSPMRKAGPRTGKAGRARCFSAPWHRWPFCA